VQANDVNSDGSSKKRYFAFVLSDVNPQFRHDVLPAELGAALIADPHRGLEISSRNAAGDRLRVLRRRVPAAGAITGPFFA
jgi:hypothetical protein